MIHRMTYSHITAVVDLCLEFFECGNLAGSSLVPDRDHVAHFVYEVAHAPHQYPAFVAVDEAGEVTGAIAGMVRPWQFNRACVVLEEIGWFVPKRFRGHATTAFQLLRALTRRGAELGATTLFIHTNVREEHPKVLRLYERLGLRFSDATFMGRIEHA